MKVFYAPEFVEQVEKASSRQRQILRDISERLEHLEPSEQPLGIRCEPIRGSQSTLYKLRMSDVRVIASRGASQDGPFWLFLALDERR
jgi:mRNA-degrading endonuclease RelE of RelBE toxin-antitoxin system